MTILLYFFIALLLSFLGSIPIGLITLTITQQTIEKGKKSGIMIALGATIMEFVYTYIALISLDFFSTTNAVDFYIKILATIVFLGMGLYYLFKEDKATNQKLISYDYVDFLKGIIVGAVNMWSFLFGYF